MASIPAAQSAVQSVLQIAPQGPQTAVQVPQTALPAAAPAPAPPLHPQTLARQAAVTRRQQEMNNWVVQSGIQPGQGLVQRRPFDTISHNYIQSNRPAGNPGTALARKHRNHPAMNPPPSTKRELEDERRQNIRAVRAACLRVHGNPYLSTIMNRPFQSFTAQEKDERKFAEFDPHAFFKCWLCCEGFSRNDTVRHHFAIHIETREVSNINGPLKHWDADLTCAWGM